jgi:sulfur relay (sulfurtransferase) DsrC/TusE family protein
MANPSDLILEAHWELVCMYRQFWRQCNCRPPAVALLEQLGFTQNHKNRHEFHEFARIILEIRENSCNSRQKDFDLRKSY